MIDFSLFTLGCAILLQFFFFNDTATTEIYTLSLHDALPIFPAPAQSRIVYVHSHGGVWETSWRKAFFEPFTAQTGIAIRTVPGVSFAKLKAQVQTRNYEWDVVNIGEVEYAQAVLENLLEKVDPAAARTDQ